MIGVDAETRVRQTVSNTNGKPTYVFDHKRDVLNRWEDADPPDTWWLTGDGTVPFEGAVPPFLEPGAAGAHHARRLRLLGTGR